MSILQLYVDKAKQWRWRLKTDEQEIVGVSGMGFETKEKCIKYVEEVLESAKVAGIEESEE
ncbi:MAG: YegP family protein [Candidatus Marinimicrobia bacterium]|nr:YegP family protein [Candidatus Neomarinimicrobiota bacterium]